MPRGLATPLRRPHGAQYTGHTSTAATRGKGDRPRPHGGHTKPRGPATPHGGHTGAGDRPRPHGGHIRPRGPPRPNGGHTMPRGPATPSRPPHSAQETGHAPTATTQGLGDWSRPTTTTRGKGDRPRPHGCHTKPR